MASGHESRDVLNSPKPWTPQPYPQTVNCKPYPVHKMSHQEQGFQRSGTLLALCTQPSRLRFAAVTYILTLPQEAGIRFSGLACSFLGSLRWGLQLQLILGADVGARFEGSSFANLSDSLRASQTLNPDSRV